MLSFDSCLAKDVHGGLWPRAISGKDENIRWLPIHNGLEPWTFI